MTGTEVYVYVLRAQVNRRLESISLCVGKDVEVVAMKGAEVPEPIIRPWAPNGVVDLTL